MKRLDLTRIESTDQGTLGILCGRGFFCFTMEPPNRGNAPNVSCIPTGGYDMVWCHSPLFKRLLFLIDPVTGRSGIRIHAGNWAGDRSKGFRSHSYGCILLGSRPGTFRGQRAVIQSDVQVRGLHRWAGGENMKLQIEDF